MVTEERRHSSGERLPIVEGSPVTRGVLLGLACIAAAIVLVTARRVPTPFADVQLYASIARARQLYGIGVPTISWNSPVAVDHIPFYGPVFFDLCVLSLRLFGTTLLSFRLVSLFGAALYVAGTIALSREVSGTRNAPYWSAALALMTPEIVLGAANGAMHTLSVGFCVLALAAFVKDFDRRRGGAGWGLLAGAFLLLAALTTPRSYPFVLGFVCAGMVPAMFGSARFAIRHRLAAAVVVVTGGMFLWATLSHGTILRWLRYMSYIATHEDTDVALLPTAIRDFQFHWSGIITPGAAIVGGLVAARALKTRAGGKDDGRHAALTFLLLACWIHLTVTSITLNYTFTIGEYIALPLFAVVISWPRDRLGIPRGAARLALSLLLVVQLGDLAFRCACFVASWRALDPSPVNAFIAQHVPRGSVVVGPREPFFFPVERSGSRFRTVSPRSWADWARWVPAIEPEATQLVRRYTEPPYGQRFFLWRADDAIPEDYQCALPHAFAAFDPAPPAGWAPQWMRRYLQQYPGYPPAILYRLPDGCPAGYDPTRPPTARASTTR